MNRSEELKRKAEELAARLREEYKRALLVELIRAGRSIQLGVDQKGSIVSINSPKKGE